MSYPVLVLNMDFSPYDVWNWQKTMVKLLTTNSIAPIYNNDGSIIKHDMLIRDGGGNEYELPQIVVLKEYIKNSNDKATYTKGNIYARDKNICQFCGELTTPNNRSVDHIIPRANYNPKRYTFKLSSYLNVVCCCRPCNLKKRNRTPAKAGMTLIRRPTHPTRSYIYKCKLSLIENVPTEWLAYIK